MKALALSTSVQAFWTALLAAAHTPPYVNANVGGAVGYGWSPSLPTPPLTPTDPLEAAFFQTVCLDLYHRLQAAQPPPAPPPVPFDPNYGAATVSSGP